MRIARWTRRLAAAALLLGLPACAGGSDGAIAAATAATSTGDSWRDFRVPGGDFAVALPEAPKPGRDTTAKDGSVNKSYYVEESRCVYMVGYSSSPAKGVSLDGWLDTTRDALPARLGGKLRGQRRFALGDSHAVEFVLDVPRTSTTDAYTIKGRIYVRHAGGGKDMLYQTLVTGKPGIDKAAETTRFLESFRF